MGRSSRPRISVDVTFVLGKPSDALPSAATGGGARVVSSANRAAMRERLRSSIQVNGNVLFFFILLVNPVGSEWLVSIFPFLFLCFCLGNDLRSRVVNFKVKVSVLFTVSEYFIFNANVKSDF